MDIVLFDTETTGLLQPENSDLTMQPKVIEFYGVRIDEEFSILDELNELIYPGEEVSSEITRITGITNGMLKGKPLFTEIAPKIQRFFSNSDLSVAHNHAFDAGVLDAEYRRIDVPRPVARNELCTVEATMGITGQRLTLTRLHWMLLQEQFNAHRAKDDVYALVRCFHNLTESGIIDLGNYRD